MSINFDKVSDRIQRAMTQDIEMQASFGTSSDVLVRIKGTTGTLYLVHICAESCSCSCEDYRNRFGHCSPICKHIICVLLYMFDATTNDVNFLATKIVQNANILPHLEAFKRGEHETRNIGNDSTSIWKRKKKEPRVRLDLVKPKNDEDACYICLEPLSGTPTTFCGIGCGKMVHSNICIQTWLRINRSCPMCKSDWVDGAKEEKIVARAALAAEKIKEDNRRHWKQKDASAKASTKYKKSQGPDILSAPRTRMEARRYKSKQKQTDNNTLS